MGIGGGVSIASTRCVTTVPTRRSTPAAMTVTSTSGMQMTTRLSVASTGTMTRHLRIHPCTHACMHGHVYTCTRQVTALVLDANFLFSSSDDGTLRIWDTHAKAALSELRHHVVPVRTVIVMRESGLLVSIGVDSKLAVWDYSKAQVVHVRCICLKNANGTAKKNSMPSIAGARTRPRSSMYKLSRPMCSARSQQQ